MGVSFKCSKLRYFDILHNYCSITIQKRAISSGYACYCALLSKIFSRGDRIRTCDIQLPKLALYQAELRPVGKSHLTCHQGTKKMARDGIEPPTRGFSIRCSTNWATEPLIADRCSRGAGKVYTYFTRLASKKWIKIYIFLNKTHNSLIIWENKNYISAGQTHFACNGWRQ